MKHLFSLAGAFAVGYWLVTKAAPVLQAKIESMDLDTVWAVYDDMHNWGDE